MKSLAKNSIYNIIYRLLNVLFPLITATYVSRILLPEGVGIIASANNIAIYFALVAALGLPTYGVKKIAEAKDRENVSKIFSELFLINCFSTLICTILYYCMIFSTEYFCGKRLLYVIVGLQIFFNIINVDWFYQGKEEFKYIMIRSMVVKIMSLTAVFIFVKSSDDYIFYALIQIVAKVANYIFNIINLRKYVDFRFKNLDIQCHMKPIFTLLAASIAIEVYTIADTTMLTMMCGEAAVGYYENARKSIDVVRAIVTAMSAVFLPRLSYYYASGEIIEFKKLIIKGFKILAFLSVPAMMGLYLLSGNLVTILFGESFYGSIVTVKILSISIVTVAFSNFIGYQILVTVGKEKVMFISTLVGALVNVIANVLMIRLFQHNGAALSSVMTEFLVTIIQVISVKKVISIKGESKFIRDAIISTALMSIVVCSIKFIFASIIWELILSSVIGFAIYMVVNIVLGNEMARMVVCRLNKKEK